MKKPRTKIMIYMTALDSVTVQKRKVISALPVFCVTKKMTRIPRITPIINRIMFSPGRKNVPPFTGISKQQTGPVT
jgi:hypothetical protein